MRFVLISLLLLSCATTQQHSEDGTDMGDRLQALSPTSGAVGGLVVDAEDGRGLAMVMVQAERGGKVVTEDFSDSDGHYQLGPLPPGNYTVRARFSETRTTYPDILIVPQEQTELKITIDLTPAVESGGSSAATYGSIEGIVLDGVDGDFFAGTVVALEAKHLSNAVLAISDENGFFRFRGLRPGSYNLSCYYQLVGEGDVEIRKNNIVVNPGKATDIEIQMDLSIGL